MSQAADPSLNRRKLRQELRRARGKAGLTQRQAADELDWSLSKVIRIEMATVSVSVTDLRAMLHLYGVDDPQLVAEMEEAARGSKGASWWARYSELVSPQYAKYLGYESAAEAIRTYHPIVVPGALQTQDYAMALLAPRVDEGRARKVVDLRMARQERTFDGDTGPESSFVLDEAALRRQIGTPAVMRGQLDHLIRMSAEPKVTIRVLPMTAGAHYSTLGSFVLFSLGDDEDDLLYVEHAAGSLTNRDDLELLARYQECFETITTRSLEGEDSISLLEHIKTEFGSR